MNFESTETNEYKSTINELATALSKAQGQMEGAKKDTTNPFFKSKYADLASVWESIRKPLSDNGLAIIQTFEPDPEIIKITTLLIHSSGQFIESRISMKPVKADPQGMGSCATYARRYALMAIVGVSPEDDDGASASGTDKKPEIQMPKSTNGTSKVEPVKSETPGTPAEEPTLREKVMGLLMLLSDGDNALMETLVSKGTEWKTKEIIKDGKVVEPSRLVAGKPSLDKVSEKQMPVLYRFLQEEQKRMESVPC